jgi:hypothetical protein
MSERVTMMCKRPFRRCLDGDLHPTEFLPGEIEIDPRGAAVAEANGWAVPLAPAAKAAAEDAAKEEPESGETETETEPGEGEGDPESGLPSHGSGTETTSSSPAPDPASETPTSSASDRPAKSGKKAAGK